PVVLVGFYDFFVEKIIKTTVIGAALAVYKVINRLAGDFWRFYARSATNSWQPVALHYRA
ncbi:MAG: hypothetical protein LBP69_06655, partial [Treponema sp.]|nr:hypothetical protein [Treponema sp.]